jgi:hypothetical protein
VQTEKKLKRTSTQQEIAASQSCAGWCRAGFAFAWNPIGAHDVILFLVMHLKPTLLAEVSIGSA